MSQQHTRTIGPPPPDLTVRVGCHLTYEALVPTPVVFMVRPRPDHHHVITAEDRLFAPALSIEEFQDSHGNMACRLELKAGRNDIRLDALARVPSTPELKGQGKLAVPVADLPPDVLRYTLPSRYCDSDNLLGFAWEHFGHLENGCERVHAICDWVNKNIEYRYGSAQAGLTASDVIKRRHGVCRDFAHVLVALCRTFNLPARYVTGYLPEIGSVAGSTPEDFHAYCEVYLSGSWYTLDARFDAPRIGRVKVSHGLDAVDGAFATIYGEAQLVYFEVWSYQVDPREISLGDPLDLSKRIDGTANVRLC